MTCNPARWLVLTPVAALPFLAALTFNTPRLEAGLAERAGRELSAGGAAWARVEFDGRDAVLSGNAPGEAALAAAAEAIGRIGGVRTVVIKARAVAPAN